MIFNFSINALKMHGFNILFVKRKFTIRIIQFNSFILSKPCKWHKRYIDKIYLHKYNINRLNKQSWLILKRTRMIKPLFYYYTSIN